MKDTIKTSRTAGYLEKIFRAVNADWFGGELEEPIITIQSTPRAYGHVTVSKVWKRKGEQRHELNIGAETLQRPIEEVVATIVHEAVHLYNLAHGVQDCSRGNTYHNKRFKEEAERRGLVISHHPTYGWTITEPSEALIDYIIAQGWAEIQNEQGRRLDTATKRRRKDRERWHTDRRQHRAAEAQQHTEVCVPLLQAEYQGDKGSQYHLRGLHGENGGGGVMAKTKPSYAMSIRCYFPGANNRTQHYPVMPLADIPKWIEAYQFTHPNAESITVKIWLKDEDKQAL